MPPGCFSGAIFGSSVLCLVLSNIDFEPASNPVLDLQRALTVLQMNSRVGSIGKHQEEQCQTRRSWEGMAKQSVQSCCLYANWPLEGDRKLPFDIEEVYYFTGVVEL